MAYFYILKSKNHDRCYLGATENVDVRLIKHNNGSVRSTKAYRPWSLVYKEKYKTITEARKREYQVKSWKSRDSTERLIRGAPSSSG